MQRWPIEVLIKWFTGDSTTAKKKEFALDKLLAQLDTEEAKEELRNLAELIGDSPGESEDSAAIVRVICVIFYTENQHIPHVNNNTHAGVVPGASEQESPARVNT